MKTDIMIKLAPRVYELGQILVCDSIDELCDSVSASSHRHTDYLSQSELTRDLVAYIKSKEITRKYVFDKAMQAKALSILANCYDFRCDSENAHMLTDGDIEASLVVATDCTMEVAEGFFRQHYTKRGVVC